MRAKPGLSATDRVLALASLSFDISTLEIFLPLLTGATVVIAGEEMNTNPFLLADALQHYHISLLQATPATWQLLLDAGWEGKTDLTALCGGDILTRTMADELLHRVGSLWNVYGPTETTVWSMMGEVSKGSTPISIGQPIANMQVYVLDRYQQPVPVGVIGELYIAGEGLARGYLNSEALTKQKFIPHPFDAVPGARIYQSGDLARYLPDGSIEMLGRADDQVKVQGHRVELGEITAVMLQHPQVTDGIVLTRSDSAGNLQLVAYLVAAGDDAPGTAELRRFLGNKLPAYMIPGIFRKHAFFTADIEWKNKPQCIAIA